MNKISGELVGLWVTSRAFALKNREMASSLLPLFSPTHILLWGWTRSNGNLNEVRGKVSQPRRACQFWCSTGDSLAWSFVSSAQICRDSIHSNFKRSHIIQGHFYSAFSYGPNCSKRRILAGPQSTDIINFMSQKPFRNVFLACLSFCTIPERHPVMK